MAILPLLYEPDPRLRLVSQPIIAFDDALFALAQDLKDTMVQEKGMGLAAPQVNIQKRLVIIHFQGGSDIIPLVNPEIIHRSDEKASLSEACLSVLGYSATLPRSKEVHIRYQNLVGETVTLPLHGLNAVCAQHEIDHLDGILYIDYLSEFKKMRYRQARDKIRMKSKGSPEKASPPRRA